MKTMLLLPLLIAPLMVACAKSDDRFLGAWESTQNAKNTFTIVRNGDAFLVITSSTLFGRTIEEKTPAVLKDGQLQLSGILGPTAIAYVEKTDTLVATGQEYKRSK